MISHFIGYAKTSYDGTSENPRYKYQVAPDMAMTVRMIMILLYGVGGEPGEGEIPMIQFSRLFPICFPHKLLLSQGALRTNTVMIHSI